MSDSGKVEVGVKGGIVNKNSMCDSCGRMFEKVDLRYAIFWDRSGEYCEDCYSKLMEEE